MKKTIFLFFALILANTNAFSQTKFSCKIVDATSKKPVVYATIMLKRINRGTHADFNGNFEIPLKYKSKETIKISSIGYKTKEVKLSQLKTNGVNIIYLSVANNKLKEIVITSTKKKKRQLLGIQIVRKAIKNILNNYPNEAHSYIGYYRDYQQPVGDSYQKNIKSNTEIKYLNVNEGIIECFDDGFDSDKLKSKKNQSLLYLYKNNNKFIQDSTLTIPYDNKRKKYSESVYITPLGGNELNILNLTNAIRNYNKMSFSYSNVFEKDFIKNHKFKFKKVVFLDSIPLYKVSFLSLKEKTSFEYSAFGTIYISKQDFAIHKFNYNLYYRDKKNPQYSVTIEYAPKKDKMYLNYITFNNFFEATNGNYFKIDKTFFNSKENKFKIYFNRQVKLKTIDKRNFKIYYKDLKLQVTDVSPFDGSYRIFNIFIDEKSISKINFEKEKENPKYPSFFKFDINKITDLHGYVIDERASIKINQYREFFVQETFQNKRIPLQKDFIDKSVPLSKAKINSLKLEHDYWLNTPLKSTKN